MIQIQFQYHGIYKLTWRGKKHFLQTILILSYMCLTPIGQNIGVLPNPAINLWTKTLMTSAK